MCSPGTLSTQEISALITERDELRALNAEHVNEIEVQKQRIADLEQAIEDLHAPAVAVIAGRASAIAYEFADHTAFNF